ncbi:MAG: ATP-binding protein [Chitinophagaceae bacterium]
MKSWLIIWCCIGSFPAFSQGNVQQVYEADARIQLHDLRDYTSVFVDSANKFSAEEIASGKYDKLFLPYSSLTKKVNPYTAYWLKVSVNPLSNIDNWWIVLRDTGKLYTGNSANDYIDVYTVDTRHSIVSHQRTGPLVPRSQKSVPQHTALGCVAFSGKAGHPLSLYLKLYNGKNPPQQLFYPQLQNPVVPVIVPHDGLDIFCAIALLFSILSFFFFFFVREKAYLFFGLYTLVLSQHYLILDPQLTFIDFYIPEHPQLISGFWRLFTVGNFILFCLFGRSFINLRELAPTTDKWFRVLLMILSGLLITDTASLMISQKNIFPDMLFFSGFAIMLAFIIRFGFLKSVLAKLYVGGAVWLLIFTGLGLLQNSMIVKFPFNPWPVGQVGQLLIYAAALAYKIRLNEKARAQARRIQEMDEIKSKFFANISHEFRTPLTLIQGPLQQIEEQVKESGKNESATVPLRQINTMRRNTDRLLELVNQLLDLSKLDSGNMKLQIITGDVLQLLKSLAASFDSMAERKQIHYHVHFPEQTHIAFFDKDKLEKIFVNLLGNAFKYTPEKGTVSIIVEMEETRLRLSVEDNGPGIAKKELDKVFDRFYQVEGTGDKGSGIGLALVKELVDLYHGQISVSSELTKGSRFRVSLPIDKNAFKENELIYGEYKTGTVFINQSTDTGYEVNEDGKLNSHLPLLLIVEDNKDLRTFIRETVHTFYQVEEAVNGKEGLEKAVALIPDVIISDVMMPVMDGFAMTEKLRKDERSSHIPVILLTAKAGQQHKIEGLETGADDYLTKPFDANELLARIENLVNQRKLLRKKFAGTIQLKPTEVSVKSLDEIFLIKTMKAVEENIGEEDFGVEELAKEVTMSRSQLHRKLSALIGKSPSDLIRQTRLFRAKELLQKKSSTPSEVAFKVGFSSHTYFSKCFKEEFGVSPSEVV